ncbi:MAG TPA: Flp family type IVb pilin [Roseiarcus sp.]|nr:Flp family type IVb pilin [Roseiarcus sp.]
MRETLRTFAADQTGATAVEYALICASIFLVIITAMLAFGSNASNMFNNLATAVAGTP